MLDLRGIRLRHTVPFKRFIFSMVTVALVNLLLLGFAVFKGAPSPWQIILVDFWILVILGMRLVITLIYRLRCPSCRKGFGESMGEEGSGYAVVQCPKCRSKWLL
jgi:DNA-directed RNA polymerase subunit RPC12/RpoP